MRMSRSSMIVSASRGTPGRPRRARGLGLVHDAAAREVLVFDVVHDQRVEVARIGQRIPHHLGALHRPPAVGEGDGARLLPAGRTPPSSSPGEPARHRRHRVDAHDRGVRRGGTRNPPAPDRRSPGWCPAWSRWRSRRQPPPRGSRSPASRGARRPARRRTPACRRGRAAGRRRRNRRYSSPPGRPGSRLPARRRRSARRRRGQRPARRGPREGSTTRALAKRAGALTRRVPRPSADGCRAPRAPPCAPRRPSRPARGSALCASSATAESISTPRFIGPGCMTSASGLAQRELLGVEAEEAEIFADATGTKRAVHALALQAQHHDDVGAGEPVAHVGEDLDAQPLDAGRHQRRGADHAHARAQRGRAAGCWSGRRGDGRCRRRSPPSARRVGPCARRMVSASSSACVGCSCAPSPALITEQSTFCASSSAAPAASMADDQDVGPHGVQRHRRVDQRLALLHRARSPTAMFMTSAPSRLPASSKDDCVRVEASKNRLIWVRPRSVAFFFSTCRLTSTAGFGEVQQQSYILGGKALDSQKVPVRKRQKTLKSGV